MKIRDFLLAGALALASGAGAAYAAAPAAQPTADDIITRQIAARGGADRLHAIRTLRFEGRLIAPGDFRLDVVQWQTRAGKTRTDASIQGLTAIQAWDGTTGWKVQPFGGRKDPETLSADDARELVDQADIDGPLYDYKAKGNTVEYLGTEDVDGTAAYKLRLTEKSGDQLTYWIDTDTLMTIRQRTRRTLHGRQEESVSDLGDYEQIGGFYFPFEVESGPPGAASDQKVKISLSKGEANVAVDDALFKMPGAK